MSSAGQDGPPQWEPPPLARQVEPSFHAPTAPIHLRPPASATGGGEAGSARGHRRWALLLALLVGLAVFAIAEVARRAAAARRRAALHAGAHADALGWRAPAPLAQSAQRMSAA